MRKLFKTLFLLIVFLISETANGQSTFITWIDNVDYYEHIRKVTEIESGKYLCNTVRINQDYTLPYLSFQYISILYMLNDNGEITDSLILEKLDDYCIMMYDIVKVENNEILMFCNALSETTLDVQLCLLITDFNLNIQSYNFFGTTDTTEFIYDFCINHNNNIVFVGTDSLEIGNPNYLLWEMDFLGNTINYLINDDYIGFGPTIIQIPQSNSYHINDGSGVLIYNQYFEFDSVKFLDNIDEFACFMHQHKIIDNSRYLKMGIIMNEDSVWGWPPEIPWDMAFLVLNENYDIENTIIFGAPDTLDYAQNVDFIDTSKIFLSGIKNYKPDYPQKDGWLSLYVTNLQGDTLQSSFYGGYGCYSTSVGCATSDGGYIIAATWWDFHNHVPPNPVDYDIVIMKVDENGLTTNMPANIPFEQTNIIIYPNPGNNYLKVESLLKNLKIKLYDLSGNFLFERGFNNSIKIQTNSLTTGSYPYVIYQNNKLIKKGIWIKNK